MGKAVGIIGSTIEYGVSYAGEEYEVHVREGSITGMWASKNVEISDEDYEKVKSLIEEEINEKLC